MMILRRCGIWIWLFQNLLQEEFLKPGSDDSGVRNISSMPPPKKLVSPESDGMPRPSPSNMPPPPPPRNMPPPPPKFSAPQLPPRDDSKNPVTKKSPPRNMPPPLSKFSAPQSPPKADSRNPVMKKSSAEPVSDTLLKLVEYGEEDDDIDAAGEESSKSNSTWNTSSKPFWAVWFIGILVVQKAFWQFPASCSSCDYCWWACESSCLQSSHHFDGWRDGCPNLAGQRTRNILGCW